MFHRCRLLGVRAIDRVRCSNELLHDVVPGFQTDAEMRRLAEGLESLDDRFGLRALPKADEIHQRCDAARVLVSVSVASAVRGCAIEPPTLRFSLQERLHEKARSFGVLRLQHDIPESS